MGITRQEVTEQLSAYLRREQHLADLVSWAEDALREGDFDQADCIAIRAVVARIGLADVIAFGLTWEDAVMMLSRLGFRAKVAELAQHV